MKYGGFFLKGLASSLQGMPQRIYEVKWKAKQEKKLKDKEDELRERMFLYTKTVEELSVDGWYSTDDISKLNAIIIAGGVEFQEMAKETHSHINSMHEDLVEQDFALVDSFIEMTAGLNLKDMGEAFKTFRGYIKTKGALTKLAAYESLHKKKYETTQEERALDIVGKLPSEYKYPYLKKEGLVGEITPTTKVPTMADEKSAIDLLRVFRNATPEQYENQVTILEQRTGLDLSAYTQDILRETGDELYNLYNTPEEVMTNVKAPKGLTVIPKRDTKTGKYYGSFSKETAPKTTPEGEITAGEKRTYDMASSIIFGSSDWVTGISKPGIISTMISNKLNMGQPLTEEEKTEVRNNYNLIKDTLPGEVISMVESQLQRYGIPLEEITPTITPTVIPEPEPEPGIIQKGVEGVKKWLEMKGIPETKEIPTPKVPPGAKEAMIPMMTKKELHDALLNTDRSDPLWDLLYQEAVKRGYITE